MHLFQRMTEDGDEAVHHFMDRPTGLQAVIAIHSTVRGPALGGCRWWPFSTGEEAVADALRLARAMTYKAALANLPMGGGKVVVMADLRAKTEARLRALGRAVESLGGRYITAEDVGTTMADMVVIHQATRYVTGLPREQGGSGDSSVLTAHGVLVGMRVCLEALGRPIGFHDVTVAIQGLGKVGGHLAQLLRAQGARLVVSDLDPARVAEAVRTYGAVAVTPEMICDVACEIFAPCALGGIVDERTASRLRCLVVAGGANNQLANEQAGRLLADRGILYAPDYAINAGGLMALAVEWEGRVAGHGYDETHARMRVEGIADTLKQVFRYAGAERLLPHQAADRLVEARLCEMAPATNGPGGR